MKTMILLLPIMLVLCSFSHASTRADYDWKGGGRLVYFDDKTYEILRPVYPVVFYDDFCGADVVIPAAGSDESGCKWVKDLLGSATCAKVADTANGVVDCVLTSASATEEAFLIMDDQRNFKIGQGLIFEARVKMSVLSTTATTEIFIGIGSDSDTLTGEVAYRCCFKAAGSGLVYAEIDDATTESTASTGITATAAQWKIYRIDCQSAASIKFYIDGVRVAESTTFAFAATGAHLVLQPWIGVNKDIGPGLGSVQIDYIRIFQDRS